MLDQRCDNMTLTLSPTDRFAIAVLSIASCNIAITVGHRNGAAISKKLNAFCDEYDIEPWTAALSIVTAVSCLVWLWCEHSGKTTGKILEPLTTFFGLTAAILGLWRHPLKRKQDERKRILEAIEAEQETNMETIAALYDSRKVDVTHMGVAYVRMLTNALEEASQCGLFGGLKYFSFRFVILSCRKNFALLNSTMLIAESRMVRSDLSKLSGDELSRVVKENQRYNLEIHWNDLMNSRGVCLSKEACEEMLKESQRFLGKLNPTADDDDDVHPN